VPAKYSDQISTQLDTDLLLLTDRKGINNSVYSTLATGRMQGSEQRCPVSAAVIAASMVSKSRNSPTGLHPGPYAATYAALQKGRHMIPTPAVDQRLLVLVVILNRLLHCNDMTIQVSLM